ncbi:MAG: addiction module protein [Bacteroidota bacterium]
MSDLQRYILSLPVSERLELVAFIISSISEKEVDATIPIPDEWIQEALSRNSRYQAGESKGFSWEEAKARIHDQG